MGIPTLQRVGETEIIHIKHLAHSSISINIIFIKTSGTPLLLIYLKAVHYTSWRERLESDK